MRSRRIPARRESVVHPRSLYSGDFALGFYRYLLARSSQRLSQWHGQNDYEGMLHVVYAASSGACCPRCRMKPAASNDLFPELHSRCQGTDGAVAGKPGKMSLRLACETLSLEPRFCTLYNSCYSSTIYATMSGVKRMIGYNFRRRSAYTSERS